MNKDIILQIVNIIFKIVLMLLMGFIIYIIVFGNPFFLSSTDKILIAQNVIVRFPELIRDIFNGIILLSAVVITRIITKKQTTADIKKHITGKSKEKIQELEDLNASYSISLENSVKLNKEQEKRIKDYETIIKGIKESTQIKAGE